MRILLTGASGFVGQAFLKSLSINDEVVCLGRKPTGAAHVQFINTDISDNSSVLAASKQVDGEFDALIHLAAYVPKTAVQDNLRDAYSVNVEGLVNILDAFKERFAKILLGSTVEVYDQKQVKGLIDEHSPVNPGSYYAATKLASEFIARTYGAKNNLNTLVMRFSVMYGPNDPISRALPNFVRSAIANEDIHIKGGETLRDYVHVEDVVASLHNALAANQSGIVNIGSGSSISIANAAQCVVDAAKSISKIIVESGGSSTDIVVDPQTAKSLIGYDAKVHFPDKIHEMIESYR
jgi:nucleoside-diphosphate-sugar epimerase